MFDLKTMTIGTVGSTTMCIDPVQQNRNRIAVNREGYWGGGISLECLMTNKRGFLGACRAINIERILFVQFCIKVRQIHLLFSSFQLYKNSTPTVNS